MQIKEPTDIAATANAAMRLNETIVTQTLKTEIPASFLQKWQEILNLLSDLLEIPASLIMRVHEKEIEVFASSATEGNPYKVGDSEGLHGGLYCETVIKNRKKLLVPNALEDVVWKDNPDVKLNMISYMGLPLVWPAGEMFGTICVLDTKENAYSALFEQLLEKFQNLVTGDLRIITQMEELERTQEALESVNGELETRVARRTEKLNLALEDAKMAGKAKAAFLATMNHELRTPLNAIIGFADLLRIKGTTGTVQAEGYVDNIHQAGVKLGGIISNILTLSDLDGRQDGVGFGIVDLVDVLAKSIMDQGAYANERNVVLDQENSGPCMVVGDHAGLSLAVSHLLNNAIKFSPKGGTVSVAIEVGATATLSIRDQGAGIPALFDCNVFEPFAVSKTPHLAGKSASGLGLAIAHRIVSAHSGSLALVNHEDGGAVATLTLPYKGTS